MNSYALGQWLNGCLAILLVLGTAYACLCATVAVGSWVAIRWAKSVRAIRKTRW